MWFNQIHEIVESVVILDYRVCVMKIELRCYNNLVKAVLICDNPISLKRFEIERTTLSETLHNDLKEFVF